MNAVLFDTHLVLWAAANSPRLSQSARALIEDEASRPCFSAVSIWEVAIKSQQRRQGFDVDASQLRRNLLNNDWTEIPITSEHAAAIGSLPDIHKDPFDRMLVAQAHVEGIELVTSDRLVGRYPGAIRKV